MTAPGRADDELELRALANTYAYAVDRRETDTFLSVFHPDAQLVIFANATDTEPKSVHDSHEALRKVPPRLARYDKTFHFVGNQLYRLEDHAATGDISCIAHHLTTDDDGVTDYIMYIRYHDEYRRGPDQRWRMARRELRPDWTESHRV